MYAHSWALCCLITVTSFPALAAGANVEIFLQNPNAIPDSTLQEMKLEVSSLLEPAGFRIGWRGAGDSATEVPGDLVVVELRGACTLPSPAIARPPVVQLGSSAVADGKVLPFSWVDCTELARMLEPYFATARRQPRDLVYGRAVARVVAHELYHVLGRTLAHTATGLTKARFELSDLLCDRTAFGPVALAGLPPSAENPPDRNHP
jgi:hypothetical protein